MNTDEEKSLTDSNQLGETKQKSGTGAAPQWFIYGEWYVKGNLLALEMRLSKSWSKTSGEGLVVEEGVNCLEVEVDEEDTVSWKVTESQEDTYFLLDKAAWSNVESY